MSVKVHDKTNSEIREVLNEFPNYKIVCRLGTILDERGMTLTELSYLTGIRVAALSELCNLKRTAISIPHLIAIGQALRITDITKLLDISMSVDDYVQFKEDEKVINDFGILHDQEEHIAKVRHEKEEEKRKKKEEKERLKENVESKLNDIQE